MPRKVRVYITNPRIFVLIPVNAAKKWNRHYRNGRIQKRSEALMQISTGFISEAGFDLTAENQERKRLAAKSSGVHYKSESICYKLRSMQLKKESPSSEWRDTKVIKSADANQHRLHTTIKKLTFPDAMLRQCKRRTSGDNIKKRRQIKD